MELLSKYIQVAGKWFQVVATVGDSEVIACGLQQRDQYATIQVSDIASVRRHRPAIGGAT